MSSSRESLTARSVVLSVLLGSDPPQLPVQLLVRTTDLFGIAEGTTRTALSRMVAAGELASQDGTYRLAGGDLLARQARQQSSRSGAMAPWSGRWRQAVVVPDGARRSSDRAELRAAMTALRFGELREGVWLRPENLPTIDDQLLRHHDLWWSDCVPDDDPGELAAGLWDLAGWFERAHELSDAIAGLLPALEAGSRTPLAEGFVLSAAVLRHFQSDPLLPNELLAPGWPGPALRDLYNRYDAAYRSVLRDWFRGQPID